MIISKTWAMPNSKTFSIKPIKSFVGKYICDKQMVIDPFANDCKYGHITNDLNPEFDTNYHLDALTFLKQMPSNMADCVLFDPPYSITQAATMYKSFGKDKLEINVANMKYWSSCKDEIARILVDGGIALSFGWNSNGLGKSRGFVCQEILLVAHGGSKNDTICVSEVKCNNEE